ncbi:DUF2510 domain-containing protein [Lysinimonas soli]|uniref:DUF2510 domain-containing protein n=1 Tax=Lysinimonas soli TaxID=1074233 RepID=A0ABW0NNU7_9MICO
MTDIITPQAGWYPDPTDSRAYRWWSGGAWTDHLTAAPSAESVWAGGSDAGQPVRVGADAFALSDAAPTPFSSRFDDAWGEIEPIRTTNHSGTVVVIVGVAAIAAYLGSLALAYSTVIPLIPGLLGLIAAVPAFRRARITGEGLAISLLGVLLSGAATVLSVLPLLPLLLGIPSATDIKATTSGITQAITFHTTAEHALVAGAQKDFGQAASAAQCPSDVLPTKGSTFSCTETMADGSTKAVNVTVTDDSGTLSWIPAAG